MTPAIIVERAQTDGVVLNLSPTGTIKMAGHSAAVERWLPLIRKNKLEIADVLKSSNVEVTGASTGSPPYYSRELAKGTHGLNEDNNVTLGPHLEVVAASASTQDMLPPITRMTADEDQAIRAWLVQIEETDPSVIAYVIEQCQRNIEARAYHLSCATEELPGPAPFDERRTCHQCANLIGRRCLAAKRGELATTRTYEPIPDMLQRCEGYAPNADDLDRRHGRERWSGLNQKGGK